MSDTLKALSTATVTSQLAQPAPRRTLWGLLDRKERWSLSWRGRLVVASALLLAGALGVHCILDGLAITTGGYLSSRAELGAMLPEAGGEYVYVRDAYGPLSGFLYAWTWFVIAKPASHIAELAGFAIPADRTFLIVEEDGAGPDHPFSGEKLSVVLALYRYEGDIAGAVDVVNAVTAYQGLGHTCGIHTSRDAHVDALALGTKTARVMVNQNLNEGAGSARNRLPFTLSLSCGTWGGNITTENVNARHFVNLTWVSRPVAALAIEEEDLFGAHWERHGR